jgi:UDP-3-O-[3-hydroxymyristoyl] glucosamine N-acyltransferase
MSEEHIPPSINPIATIAPTAVIGTAPVGVAAWTLPPAVVEGDTHIGDHTIVHAAAIIRVGASIAANCTIGAHAAALSNALGSMSEAIPFMSVQSKSQRYYIRDNRLKWGS